MPPPAQDSLALQTALFLIFWACPRDCELWCRVLGGRRRRGTSGYPTRVSVTETLDVPEILKTFAGIPNVIEIRDLENPLRDWRYVKDPSPRRSRLALAAARASARAVGTIVKGYYKDFLLKSSTHRIWHLIRHWTPLRLSLDLLVVRLALKKA